MESLYTPCYVIDLNKFDENIKSIEYEFINEWGPNVKLGYSMKTNHFPFLLQQAKTNGLLAEVVSGDEYNFAISQGYEPKQIIYNGPNKDEITLVEAIKQESLINIDNFQDIKIIEKNLPEIGGDLTKLGIRANFDLENICKGETTAGSEVSRFGFCVENGDFERALVALNKLGLSARGLHMHYSTKSRSIGVFKALANKAAELISSYKINDDIEFVDIGGGFWGGRLLPNKPSMQEYSKIITYELKKSVSPDKVQLIIEPGASILATGINYLCKVMNIRMIRDATIATVDGSILHINPFMLNRQSEFSTNSVKGIKIPKQIICGSTCMENDRLLYLNNYNEFRKGDIITFHNAGAYTMCYNNFFINCPPYVYVKDKNRYHKLRDKLFELKEKI